MPHWKLTALSKPSQTFTGGPEGGCDLVLDENLEIKLGRSVAGTGAYQLPSEEEWLQISSYHATLRFDQEQVGAGWPYHVLSACHTVKRNSDCTANPVGLSLPQAPLPPMHAGLLACGGQQH
jgi:hypothetical protein